MFSWVHPHKKPLIVAHRGSSNQAPENTLGAFQRAVDESADAIELDVRCTADGEVIVFHDAYLRRTTNGTGLVEHKTLRQLRTLSAGSWFGRPFEGENIPTLDETIGLINGRLGINIEIKSGGRSRPHDEIVDRCDSIVRNHHAESLVLYSSFQHRYLEYLKRSHPHLAVGYLYHVIRIPRRLTGRPAQRRRGDYLVVSSAGLRPRFVERAHREGLLVGTFTVNTPPQLVRALRMGVDAIFTDEPGGIRNSLPAIDLIL